jgi:hypothetical protein
MRGTIFRLAAMLPHALLCHLELTGNPHGYIISTVMAIIWLGIMWTAGLEQSQQHQFVVHREIFDGPHYSK